MAEKRSLASSASPHRVNCGGLLRSTLAEIKHLDLTEYLSYDDRTVTTVGANGSTHVGTCKIVGRGEVKVVVKCIPLYLQQRPDITEFIEREICVWTSLKHANVLPLFGYSIEENGFPSLVSEFMENGTVLQYAQRHPELDVIHMILGIAEGMGYLHDKGVIHSELKSDNVLVSELGQPLMCDFGISRMISISQTIIGQDAHVQNSTSTLRGSSRWMSPELLIPLDNQPTVHSKSSDVWAFGMTTYELLTKRRPYHQLISDPQVFTAITCGRLPDKPESFDNWPSHYLGAWNLCEACWLKEPSTRPRMSVIITRAKEIYSILNPPGLHDPISSTTPVAPPSLESGQDILSFSENGLPITPRNPSLISTATGTSETVLELFSAASKLTLNESLPSERTRALDLSYMQDVQLPRAQGKQAQFANLATHSRLPSVSSESFSACNQYDPPMTKGDDEPEKDPELAKLVANRIHEAQRQSENLQTIASLTVRVKNWKDFHPSILGEFILEDIFVVAKMHVERVRHVVLFERVILFYKDVVPETNGGTLQKGSNVMSIFKKLASCLPYGMELSGKQTMPLLLKGCLHMQDISCVRHTITPGSSNPQYSLQVWWNGGDEHFSLKCRSQDQLDEWESVLSNLIKRRERTDSNSQRHPSVMQTISVKPRFSILQPSSSQIVTLQVYFLDEYFVLKVSRTIGYEELLEKVAVVRLLGSRRDDGSLKIKYVSGDGVMVSLATTKDVQMAFETLQPGSSNSSASTRRASYRGLLRSTLAEIKHLDLTECLTYDNTAFIAGGAYGDIRVGICDIAGRGKVKVAVKCIRLYLQQRPDIAKFIEREIRVWSSLKHTNILPLLGYSVEDYGFPSFISEFMENGTVLQYVQRLPELDVINMILGIAEGVGYLHDNGVVHSDLKSDNVLISNLGEPLICDFGISRMISISQSLSGRGSHPQSSTSTVRGSSRWMSPELLLAFDEKSASHSKESDIWAFGMTVYETLTRKRPYHGLKSDPQVITAIMRGRLPDRPESLKNWPVHYHGVWNLCEACWLKEPSTRPRMGHIITRLKDAVSNIASPSLDSMPSSSMPPYTPSSDVGRDALSLSTEKPLPDLPESLSVSSSAVGSEQASSATSLNVQNTGVYTPLVQDKLMSRASRPPPPTRSLPPPPPPPSRSPLRPSPKSVSSFTTLVDLYTRRDTMVTLRTDNLNTIANRKKSVASFTAPLDQYALNTPIIPSTPAPDILMPDSFSLFDETPLLVPSEDDSPPNSSVAAVDLNDIASETVDTLASSAPVITKRDLALNVLLSSERAYVSDLAVIRDVHIPMALGKQAPLQLPSPGAPPRLSSSSFRTLSTIFESLSSSNYYGPPMTKDDVRLIFGNITELVVLSDEFSERLEEALGNVLEGGKGEDWVGALFLDIIPKMKPLYMYYITKHPRALKHLNSLARTPALDSYLAQTQSLASSLTHTWDLPSLLIKPVHRLLNYPTLLATIIEQTPDSHSDKASLKKAHIRMEELTREVNEGRRRMEVVNVVLTGKTDLGKLASLQKKLSIGKTTQAGVGHMQESAMVIVASRSKEDDEEEAARVAEQEKQLKKCVGFVREFAKDIVGWAQTVRASQTHLRAWTIDFGKTIGISEEPSEAFNAFMDVIDMRLMPLCQELDDLVAKELLPELVGLLDTTKSPLRLLAAMHALEPLHNALLNLDYPRRWPSAKMVEASKNYLALRGQLLTDLPKYLDLLDKGIVMCIRQFARRLTEFWSTVRDQWGTLWDCLRMEGETNAGCEETLIGWRSRYSELEESISKLFLLKQENPFKRASPLMSGSTSLHHGSGPLFSPTPQNSYSFPSLLFPSPSSSQQDKSRPRTPDNLGRLKSRINTSPLPASSSQRSLNIYATYSSHSALREYTESIDSRNDARGRKSRSSSLSQRLSEKLRTPLRHSPSQKSVSSQRYQRSFTQNTSHGHFHVLDSAGSPVPPVPLYIDLTPPPNSPSMYYVSAVHPCSPPEGAIYMELPFLHFHEGDMFGVLSELGHPSHFEGLCMDLEEGEDDCLLVLKNEDGDIGLALASFLVPTS